MKRYAMIFLRALVAVPVWIATYIAIAVGQVFLVSAAFVYWVRRKIKGEN